MTNGKLQQWKSVFLSVILLFGLAPIDAREPAPSFDIVITNGRIIDGTGSPWYSGDIGIRAGRIAAIGSLSAASRSRTIDARGKIVAPGFIDMLGQSEYTILVDPRLPSKIYQGITTEITGEGESIAPLNDAILRADQEQYDHYHIQADWRTFREYFSRLEKQRIGIMQAIDEALRIGREAHIPVEIWHFKVGGKPSWGHMPEAIAKVNAARAEGLDVSADTYAYTAWFNDFSAFIPAWAHDGGNSKLIERLKDPAMRARIRKDMLTPSDQWDNEWQEIPGPEAVLIGVVHNPQLLPLQGKTLAEIAKLWNKDPMDALFDLLIEDHALTSVAVFGMSEPDVSLALQQPWVSVDNDSSGTSPDGILGQEHPHPRAYGTFPRILHKYVREEHKLTLEDAIRKFSALPAQRMRLTDRGVLKAGMCADIVIFDPARVHDVATFENPNQLSQGMEYVLVDGVPVIDHGEMTGALPGKVLRGPGYVP